MYLIKEYIFNLFYILQGLIFVPATFQSFSKILNLFIANQIKELR